MPYLKEIYHRSTFWRLIPVHVPIFLLILALYQWHLYEVMISGKGDFIFVDHLINYADGGFKRRGLSGSIFLFLNSLTNVPIPFLVFAWQSLCYFFLVYSIHQWLNRLYGLAYLYALPLIISPFVLLFPISDTDAVGRKEFMFHVLMILFINIWNGKWPLRHRQWISALLFSFTMLWHEALFFYLPWFLFVIYQSSAGNNKEKTIGNTLLIVSSVMVMFLIAAFGQQLNEGNTLSIYAERGLLISAKGILSPEWESFNVRDLFQQRNGQWPMAIVIYLIYFLAGWLISRKFNRATKALPEGHFNKLLLFSIVFSVPLFYLGVDWGRWLAIHFHLLLLILLSNASMNTTAGKEKPTTRHYLVCLLMMLPAAFKLSVMIPEWPLTLRYFLSDLL